MVRMHAASAGAAVLLALNATFATATAVGSEIEQVVVTAQKRESTLQETPIAITALTSGAIEDRQIDGLRQVQFVTPNLVLNSLGGTTNLYIRGIGTDINDSLAEPGVALYVNGVYQGVTGDQSAIYNDLERIEVLRGPQGTLYGRNSTGGNVHIVTRQPGFDPQFDMSLLMGDYDRFKVAMAGQRSLVDDRVAARASVVVDRRDGVRKNPFDGKEIDELDLTSGSIALLFTPSEALDIVVRGDLTRRRDDTPRWDYIEAVPGSGLNPMMFGGVPSPGAKRVTNDGRTAYKTDNGGVSATITWDVAGVTVKSITAYRESDWRGEYDNDGTNISFLQAKPTQTSDQWSQELDVAGTALDDRLDWIVGLYYFQQDSMSEYTYELAAIQPVLEAAFSLPPGGLADPALNPVYAVRYNTGLGSAIPFNDFHTEQETESRAVFAQGTYHLNDATRLTAGARYTSDTKDIVQSWHVNISPAGCSNLEQGEKWNEVTWKLGADRDLSDNMLLYGSVAQGFHAGGFNGGSCGDEYDPEQVIAYEVGLKSQFFDNRVRLNLAAFHYDYDDYQARLFIGGSAVIQNAAKASVRGAEAEFLLRPLDGLEIDGSLSFLDGEFDDFSSVNPMQPALGLIDLKGNSLLRSPKYSYNVGIQYSFAEVLGGTLTGRYDAAFKDDYYITIFNDEFARIESQTVQSVRLLWNSGSWRVQAFVENLADEKYLEALVATPTVGGMLGMWALPRTWGLEVSYATH